jgi:hypothetical protein|tara:strand:- start:111 stop:218 length:108 start_codon:yes stop_codon:yes gene_type:complete
MNFEEFMDDAFLFSIATLYLGAVGFSIAMLIGYLI